jgi:ATP-dependent helicase/nuclease subunit B
MAGGWTKHELFERLAQGHAARITVVTPNRRLAHRLKSDFDDFQAGKGLSVWEDADILPLEAFIGRCYEDALYADGGESLPLLVSAEQSRELWLEAIEGSSWSLELQDKAGTAARAMRAWELAQEWGITGGLEKFAQTEDTQAFAEWAKGYARRLKKDALVDAAGLPALGLKAPKTRLLVAYAFDLLSPRAAGVLSRFDHVDCAPQAKKPALKKSSFASPTEELEAAAQWARGKLEAGAKRIAVVVPDLQQRRKAAARTFARVMGSAAPFNISIGEPLAHYPVVAAALTLIELSGSELPYERASRLLRSPFLGGADTELASRALLDARLRRNSGASISLPGLIAVVEGCPRLRGHLEKVYALRGQKQSPQDWAQHFTALLEAAGFPGERVLDPAEFQARAKFNELLGDFARLGLVTSRLSFEQALARLRRLCDETLFQPEGSDAPVQVLGLLEAAGMEFDALWVSGLADGKWPQRAHPDPFLPLGLQRKAKIPQASAEESLALDKRRTAGWLGAADEVVLSWPRREEDADLAPSPLIATLEAGEVKFPSYPRHRDLIFAARALEGVDDAQAPALREAAARGGTRVLADQAACPFRAFARHRLGARELESPAPGLDARGRGILVHALMAGVWQELKTSASLEGDVSGAIERSAQQAVAELGLEGRFAALETERLKRLAAEWLEENEKPRAPFEVVLTEEKRELVIGGLRLSGRLDRMDRLADGTHAVIDYKSAKRVTANDWIGPRPEDPQVPLYAVTAPEPISAAAFAKFRAGDMKFSGFSLRRDVIPDVKPAKDWNALRAGWKKTLEALAHDFSAGKAQVDPKELFKTCNRCDLHTLCRVHEKLSALSPDEEEGV